MVRTACTEPQCLYKGVLYLYLYTIRMVQVNQDGLELHVAYQILVMMLIYWAGVYILQRKTQKLYYLLVGRLDWK